KDDGHQAVQDLLPVLAVARPPLEVALDVRESEDGDRANVVEAGHAVQGDLERDRGVALDLLGGPARGLHDRLDPRRHRIRIRLEGGVRRGQEPEPDQSRRAGDDEKRPAQGGLDEATDHHPLRYSPAPERRIEPETTTRSPGLSPERIPTQPSSASPSSI